MVGEPSDHELLRTFASECDVVTLESEFINERDQGVIEEAGSLLYPSSRSGGRIQDKPVCRAEEEMSLAGFDMAFILECIVTIHRLWRW